MARLHPAHSPTRHISVWAKPPYPEFPLGPSFPSNGALCTAGRSGRSSPGGTGKAKGTHPRPGSDARSPTVALGQPHSPGCPFQNGREWRTLGGLAILARGWLHRMALYWVRATPR